MNYAWMNFHNGIMGHDETLDETHGCQYLKGAEISFIVPVKYTNTIA